MGVAGADPAGVLCTNEMKWILVEFRKRDGWQNGKMEDGASDARYTRVLLLPEPIFLRYDLCRGMTSDRLHDDCVCHCAVRLCSLAMDVGLKRTRVKLERRGRA